MSYYGTVQAGLNFIQGPTVEVTGIISEDYGKKDKITYKMDMATTFGISIGGGIIFNDKFTVGLRYLMLGNPDIKIKTKSTEEGISYTDEYEKDQPISIFLLTVGMRL